MIYLSAPRNVLVREITSEKDLTTNHGGEIIYGQGRFTMRQAPRAPTKILMRFRKWTFLLRKSLRTFNSCNVVDRPFTNPNWKSDNRLFDTKNSTIKFLLIVSKTLQTMLVMLTGLYLLANLRFPFL